MHVSHRALRQPCRAQNAYNVVSALASAFCTASNLRQDATRLKHRSVRPRAGEETGGSFASYEALSEKFSKPGGESARQGRTQAAQSLNQNSKSLLARQAVIDGPEGVSRRPLGARKERPPKRTERNTRNTRNTGTREEGEQAQLPEPLEAQEQDDAHSPSFRTYQIVGGGNQRIRKHGDRKNNAQAARPPRESQAREDTSDLNGNWKAHMQKIAHTVNDLTRRQVANSGREVSRQVYHELDYESMAIPPMQSLREATMLMPWALDQTQVSKLGASERLEAEIARFAAHMEPTPAEKAARQAVVIEASALIKETLHLTDTRVELFGSEKTGLALANSDIDLRIYDGAWEGQNDAKNMYNFGKNMRVLFDRMDESAEWICVVFRRAKFPIISAQHRATGIDVQIVSSPSTAAQQECTRRYLEELPHLRSLYSVVRTTLGMRGLIDVFNGGIGSYGLFMMLLAALKRRSSDPPITASEQLLRFFDLYRFFNVHTHGLTIEPVPKMFRKHDGATTPLKQYIEAAHRREDPVRAGQWAISQLKPLQPYLLCLQDPANPVNDLGRKTNAIKHIRKTLHYLRQTLLKQMKRIEEAREKGKVWEEETLLEMMVGRCHEVYFEQRRRVEGYGRAVLEGKAAVDVREVGGIEQETPPRSDPAAVAEAA